MFFGALLALVLTFSVSTQSAEAEINNDLASVAPPPLYSIGYFGGSGTCKTFTRCSTGYTFTVDYPSSYAPGQLYKITLDGSSTVCTGAGLVINAAVWEDCDF